MLKVDYHMHTNFSPDSFVKMEDMILKAIKLKLEEIAITDHLDFSYPDCNYNIDLPKYIENISFLQDKYKSNISILKGIEMSIRPDSAEICKKIANSFDFDFIIGSTHDIRGIDWYYPENYINKTKKEAYGLYFENMLSCIESNNDFDVVGHLDYVCRYGKYQDKSLVYNDYLDIIDEILKKIIFMDKGIEINTSGYKAYGLKHFHPQKDILKRYLELGGKIITVGSDAHSENRIYDEFKRLYLLLQELGVKYIARYKNRELYFSKI